MIMKLHSVVCCRTHSRCRSSMAATWASGGGSCTRCSSEATTIRLPPAERRRAGRRCSGAEERSVAIDFRLTERQRELQLQSRKFASEVLAPAIEAETLPTPEQRFAATRPAYEAMIAAGFLRKCIPLSAGGESSGLIDTAIMVEELYAVNASVTLTLIGTLLGLLPLLIGGSERQKSRLLPPFL